MIISHKTEAFPIPNIQVDGRQLFIEIRPFDNESTVSNVVSKIREILIKTMKEGKVPYTKVVNCEPLQKTIIE